MDLTCFCVLEYKMCSFMTSSMKQWTKRLSPPGGDWRMSCAWLAGREGLSNDRSHPVHQGGPSAGRDLGACSSATYVVSGESGGVWPGSPREVVVLCVCECRFFVSIGRVQQGPEAAPGSRTTARAPRWSLEGDASRPGWEEGFVSTVWLAGVSNDLSRRAHHRCPCAWRGPGALASASCPMAGTSKDLSRRLTRTQRSRGPAAAESSA